MAETTLKFFRKPFAVQGDREVIPDDLQTSGKVSMDTGWGFDYERDQETDPNAKDVERLAMNWLFGTITETLRQYQTEGTFRFITSEMNGGQPHPYIKGARCLFDAGSGLDLYESLVANNTALPTEATKWQKVRITDLVPITRKINTSGSLTGGGALDKDLNLSVTVPSSVPPSRTITTTSPLTGGGDLSANRTLGINAASAATANYVILRDSSGRAQVAAPAAAADIARKADVDAVKALIPAPYDISMTLDYFLGWHVFTGGIHPVAKPGMVPVDGRWITAADTKFPKIWAYLQSAEGKQLCVTSAVYTQMNTAVWHTNADGTKVGWEGVGGVPRYCLDIPGKRLRVPDLRGMSLEVFGCSLLDVGGVHGDGIRNIPGWLPGVYGNAGSGAFGTPTIGVAYLSAVDGTQLFYSTTFDPSKVVPVASKNQPRSWGSLACVYLGVPAV